MGISAPSGEDVDSSDTLSVLESREFHAELLRLCYAVGVYLQVRWKSALSAKSLEDFPNEVYVLTREKINSGRLLVIETLRSGDAGWRKQLRVFVFRTAFYLACGEWKADRRCRNGVLNLSTGIDDLADRSVSTLETLIQREDTVIQDAQLERILQTIQTLIEEENFRTAFMKRLIDKVDFQELADFCDLPLNTFKSRFYRKLAEIQEAMQPQPQELPHPQRPPHK